MAFNLQLNKQTASMSGFKATDEEAAATAAVQRDYSFGHTILNKPYEEFNFLSIVQQINSSRKAFNAYVPPKSDDPDDSWRAQTIRPIVRQRLITIAARITQTLLIPRIFPQNNRDEEDKEAALILNDLLEWAIKNSNYERKFIDAVITALVDPIVYVNQDFKEVFKKVREMKEDGTSTEKEMLDEVLSGFQTAILPAQDMYFANIYEPDIQRQRFLIHRSNIDFLEAKAIYGQQKNFKHVKSGITTLFIEQEAVFYEQRDNSIRENEVEVVKYWSRPEDLELIFVNGIIVSDPQQPMRRKDKLYPIAKTGYEPINDGRFFLYKSAADKVSYDEDLVNTLYNYVMDGTFLSLMPPLALYGNEDIDGPSVMVPGAVTTLREESRLEPIGPRSDLRAGLAAINVVEDSINQSTQSPTQAGVSDAGEKTAFEVATLEQNAKTALGLFGKFIGFMVEDIGTLIVGDILQFVTVPEIGKITGITDPLKYKTILVPDRILDGKKFTRKIEFTDEMLGSEDKSDEQLLEDSFKILDQEGMDSDVRIAKVNPQLIREMKYLVSIDPDQLTPPSKSLERAMKLEMYDRAIGNPIVDVKQVTQDFLFEPFAPGESDKYIRKPQEQPNVQGEQQIDEATGGIKTPSGVGGNLTGQLTGSNSLKNAQTNQS